MNKADIIAKLAPKLYITQDEARVILNSVLEVFTEALVEASNMMASSLSFTQRATRALSIFSANRPAVAENRKNGRMNKPEARLTICTAGKPANDSPA